MKRNSATNQQQTSNDQQRPTSITQEELCNLETALAKTQKESETTETEVGRLWDELRQSLDWETSIKAQARKALKETHEKLQEEVTTHRRKAHRYGGSCGTKDSGAAGRGKEAETVV